MGMNLRKVHLVVAMGWFEAQRFRAFPLEVIASLATLIIESLLFIVFWLLVGKYAGTGALNQRDIISYFLIMSGMTPFFFMGFGIGSQIIRLIKSGELNQVLIKPVNPLIYPWTFRMGRNAISMLFGLVQILAGIVVAGGVTGRALPFLLPVLINMAIINAAFNIFIGTMGFYLVEAAGVKNAFVHLARFCRGELMPLFLMPASVATWLQFSPFPASHYHLAIALQGERLPEWRFVLIGFVWAVVLMAVALLFWRRGLRHYEAVGI